MLDKKTRLNSTIRDQIVENALKTSGYCAEEKQLIEDRAAFAAKVHALVLEKDGTSEKELDKEWSRVNKQGSQYIYSRESKNTWTCVNLAGISVELVFNGGNNSCSNTHLGTSRGDTSIQRWVRRARPNIADVALKEEYLALAKRQDENSEKRNSVESTVRAVVRSVGTVGKLLEAWPEAAELLPEEMLAVSGTGLAVIPADLNALCGIPSPK